MVTLTELLAGLPPEPNEASLFVEIRQEVARSQRKLVVIDDDPTGTQTVHDIELFTTWNRHMLAEALQNEPRLFYLLTNSRSMPERDAVELNKETAQQLAAASEETKTGFVVISRSDSTLRGHYPAEIQALERGFTFSGGESFDGHLLVPAFFEGGRYTIHDTHYVATPIATSDTLQPASETSFARDSVFGYKTAYLPAWIEAKSGGHWKAHQVMCIGLEVIRQGGPEAVASKLQTVAGSIPVVINAAGYGDLAVIVLGLLWAEAAEARESSLTDPTQAHEFITSTGAAMLAISIGNAHGYVPVSPPLDFERLAQIAAQVDVPLVLHGASGISREDIQHAIHMGIAKLNVNTEVRAAFLRAIAGWGVRVGPEPDLRKKGQDLLDLMQEAMAAAQGVVEQTIRTCNFLLNAHD